MALDGHEPALGKDRETHDRARKALRAKGLGGEPPQEGQLRRGERSVHLALERTPDAHELLARGQELRGVLRAHAAAADQRAAQLKLLGLAGAGVVRAAQIDELELQGAAAAEFIDLKVEGGVHALADGQAAFRGGDGEEDAVEARVALLEPELEMLILSYALHGLQPRAAQAENRAVVARAVGLETGKLLDLLKRDEARAGEGGVDLQRGDGGRVAAVGADVLIDALAEGGDILLLDGEARGELVPAEADEQVAARLERGEEVEAAVAAAGALAHAAGEVDHEAGTGEFFGKTRGDDADHALMPFLAREHERVALGGGEGVHLLDGAAEDILLDALALAVEVAQLAGEPLGLGGVLREQELGGQLRAAHASGGVDAGGEDEADLHGGDRTSGQAGLAQQRVKAREVAAVDALKAALDDGAVFALHAHDVGNGADGGKGAVAGEERAFALGAAEGEDQLERDADAGKMLERKAAVRAVRVDHGAGGGQLVLTFVVIGDDEVDAEGGGKGGLLHAGDAAVHGDDERDALLGKRADRVAAEAVALLDAAGNVHEHRRAAGAEIIGQKAGGGDAVHVVIAEHGDGLAAGKRAVDARHGLVHIAHEEGGVDQRAFAVEMRGGLLGRHDAARGQYGRYQIGIACVHQSFDRGVIRFRDEPAFVFHAVTSDLYGKSAADTNSI